MPLTMLLGRENIGYGFGKDNLKLYESSLDKLESLKYVVSVFSKDIENILYMEFRLDKFAVLVLKQRVKIR